MTEPIRIVLRGLALTLALLVSTTALTSAQAPDFLFSRPSISIGLYGGWSMPREGSDIFDHVREEMTIQQGDFDAPLLGADLAFSLTNHLDVVLGVEGARATRHSELLDWVEDGWPIEQTTEFGWTRLNASGRVYLLDRGHTVGTHAWVPARWSAFVGGGGGIAWYSFEQYGDFIDYTTIDDPLGPEIVTGTLRTSGNGGSLHALAGLEITLTPRLALRGEYRYYWGTAPVDARDFRGFEPFDLAGHRATIGIATRF